MSAREKVREWLAWQAHLRANGNVIPDPLARHLVGLLEDLLSELDAANARVATLERAIRSVDEEYQDVSIGVTDNYGVVSHRPLWEWVECEGLHFIIRCTRLLLPNPTIPLWDVMLQRAIADTPADAAGTSQGGEQ